ncbi:hypothetical protein K438DRAFT_1565068 [Mycena galopus ATCC 62051]|nr:hypothetical protein K438DRAFT_1565068 [Mycena galopus ATCC 62051]
MIVHSRDYFTTLINLSKRGVTHIICQCHTHTNYWHLPPTEPALISDCELVNYELHTVTVEELIELTFDALEKKWGVGGSPYQKWYRIVATGKDAIIDKRSTEEGVFENSRLIAWKKGQPFEAQYLFFRTVDTRRLLPMHLADFRMQFYGHHTLWEELDAKPNGRKKYVYSILSSYFHPILVLRNMHDKGGADVPFILTAWDDERLEEATKYWADLSKGEWSEEEQRSRYAECLTAGRSFLPCFPQTDVLVRALLSDPEVGYVPPFIIINSILPRGKTSMLFTSSLHVPPPALLQNIPASCNSPNCPEINCAPIDMSISRSLADNSPMVRKWDTPGPKRVVCNLRGCEIQHSDSERLLRCQRCREVLYCSTEHQSLDWRSHKKVCEKRF